MAKRRKQRQLPLARIGAMVALAFACFVVGVFWGRRAPEVSETPPVERAAQPVPKRVSPPPTPLLVTVEPAETEPAPVKKEPASSALTGPAPTVPVVLTPVAAGHARLALVIDDLGRSVGDVDRLRRLGVEWTAAVLPFESRTADVVSALRAIDVEYLCHLPMQPVSANPGPGALRIDMSADELAAATRAALAAVPGAAGVNNHMGSVLSANRVAMVPILGELAASGLFFLDSRTSAASIGYGLALELGLPATQRQVFLDSDRSQAAIARQFVRWLELARSRGTALAIGHPHADTFAVLEREIPRAIAAGYEFIPVSYLLDRPDLGVEP